MLVSQAGRQLPTDNMLAGIKPAFWVPHAGCTDCPAFSFLCAKDIAPGFHESYCFVNMQAVHVNLSWIMHCLWMDESRKAGAAVQCTGEVAVVMACESCNAQERWQCDLCTA
eukprot:scaffold202922_cov24-Tisochrysis_lutea.AAC.1